MGDIGGLFLSLRVFDTILMLILHFDGHLVYIMSQLIDENTQPASKSMVAFTAQYN